MVWGGVRAEKPYLVGEYLAQRRSRAGRVPAVPLAPGQVVAGDQRLVVIGAQHPDAVGQQLVQLVGRDGRITGLHAPESHLVSIGEGVGVIWPETVGGKDDQAAEIFRRRLGEARHAQALSGCLQHRVRAGPPQVLSAVGQQGFRVGVACHGHVPVAGRQLRERVRCGTRSPIRRGQRISGRPLYQGVHSDAPCGRHTVDGQQCEPVQYQQSLPAGVCIGVRGGQVVDHRLGGEDVRRDAVRIEQRGDPQ
jgi:hypothetical protein